MTRSKLKGVVVRQMDEGLRLAKAKYFRAVRLAARGLKSERGPWLIARGIAPALFESWADEQESRWKIAYEDERGSVLLYGDPSRVHETAAGYFNDLIQTQLIKAALSVGGVASMEAAGDALVSAASPLFRLVNSNKEPDFSRTPRDRMDAAPTLVGEIAYHNESYAELKRELTRWTARPDLAQMCVGLNINDEAQGASVDPYLTLVCKRYQQPHVTVTFGKGSQCSSAGLQQYQFAIPMDVLFAGSNLRTLFGQQAVLHIDLFKLRTLIKDLLVASS